MGPLSIPLKDKRKWSICVITIHWGIKSTRKQSALLQFVNKNSPLPIWIRLRSDYGQLKVRSRSVHSPITVHSKSDYGQPSLITVNSHSDHGPLTVRSRSTQSPITVSSQPDHGQLPVRSRSDHSVHTSVRNCIVPWKWSPVQTLLYVETQWRILDWLLTGMWLPLWR
jgi:hypothetical protein